MNRREFGRNLLYAAGAVAWPRMQAAPQLQIKGERLQGQLRELAEFGRNPQGGVSRAAYSDADLRGREYALKLMRDAGLEAGTDAAGNLVGRRQGSEPGLKPLALGSHIDSVSEGGSYDGTVGSLGAIETARTLAESGLSLRHPLEVILFQNEEGGTVGSRAIAKGLTDQELDRVTSSGKSIREGIRFIGGDLSGLSSAVRKSGDIAAYLELHIEQGGILDAEKLDIGVVEGIVGINWWDVTIEGSANHAGTTPMNQRRDALLAAAQYVEAVNRVVTGMPGRQVGTVGRIQAFPGAYNVIPGRVATSLEVRDMDAAKMDAMYAQIRQEVAQIEQRTGTRFEFKPTNSTPPAPTDSRIRGWVEASAKQLGLKTKLMPSGAGHDAQEVFHLGPVGMIFIPSVGGISHSPREFSRPEDIVRGTNVLLHTLIKMDSL